MRMLLLLAFAVAAQPRVSNAKLETRAMRGTLTQEIAAIEGPAWVAYAVPAVKMDWGSCSMQASPVLLEGSKDLYVFVRVEARRAVKIRSFNPNCEFDAGGLSVLWLTGVSSAQSVAFLTAEQAVHVIGMHPGAEADAALESFVSSKYPEKTTKHAAFWLGSTRRQRGVNLLTKLLKEDPSEPFRLEVVFALSRSPEGVAVLIDLARRKVGDVKVRQKAVFWLASSEDAQARRFVDEVLAK